MIYIIIAVCVVGLFVLGRPFLLCCHGGLGKSCDSMTIT